MLTSSATKIWVFDAYQLCSRVFQRKDEETPTQTSHCNQLTNQGLHNAHQRLVQQLKQHWYVEATTMNDSGDNIMWSYLQQITMDMKDIDQTLGC